MTREILKTTVGIYLVVVHFAAILGVFYLGFTVLELEDALDVIFIMAPIFSVHSTLIVKDFIKNQTRRRKGPRVNRSFMFVSFFLPIVFTIALGIIIFGFANNLITTPALLKRCFAVLETVFGLYLGFVTENLFRDGTGGGRTAG